MSPALLVASIAAVAIGTVEVTLREHLGGYRSHAVLLALIPVVVLHSAVLLVAGAFTSVPRWVNIPLLAIDIAIFSVLYKLLRLRYLDATPRAAFRPLSRSQAPAPARAGAAPRRRAPRPGSRRCSRAAPGAAISRSPSTRAGWSGGRPAISVGDAVAQLQREMRRRGAHQLAHVLDGHLAGALLALHAPGVLGLAHSGCGEAVCSALPGGFFAGLPLGLIASSESISACVTGEIMCSSPISQP